MLTQSLQTTCTATGQSALADSREAGRQAAEQAKQGFVGDQPQLVIAFVSPTHAYEQVLAGIQAVWPGVAIVGASTAGEYTERGAGTGVALMAIAGPSMAIEVSSAGNLRQDPNAAADAALGDFTARARDRAVAGFPHATVMMLSDGLAGRGEDLVAALSKKAGLTAQIVGGAAADAGKFEATQVFENGTAAADRLVTASIFSKTKLGVGVRHGLVAAADKMKVTKSDKAVLYELDGKPAFEAYKAFAATRGIDLVPETAGGYMIAHELGIQMMGNISKIRAPLSVNADGSLNMATEVPVNSFVTVMDAPAANLIEAAREAALEAKKNLGGQEAAGVLVFDCICRNINLGDAFKQEIDAVRGVFGEVPVLGFMTYGEIAKYAGQLTGFHNSTAVVVALPK